MVMELSIQPPAAVDGPSAARNVAQAAVPRGGTAATAGTAFARPAEAVSDEEALHAAATRAASALYGDREVEVSSFRDERTGRMVHRIADTDSGRVLMQSPSDELLRFYASSRPSTARPLLAIDA